jgi:hypothetical protein
MTATRLEAQIVRCAIGILDLPYDAGSRSDRQDDESSKAILSGLTETVISRPLTNTVEFFPKQQAHVIWGVNL